VKFVSYLNLQITRYEVVKTYQY